MRLISMVALACAVFSLPVFASRTSYRNAHPLTWMHWLPVGEMPGWNGEAWVEFEVNHANIWNQSADFLDKRNGTLYTYKADFEQSSAILEMGYGLSSSLALSLELPYAYRNGGILDDFIDQFHQTIQSDRFFRHLNEDFNNSFVVQKDGIDQLATSKGQGVGGTKVKMKWWPVKWLSPTRGACDCGIALSGQVKLPLQDRQFGLSSGTNDYSGLLHVGVPLGKYSAAWTTAAVTKLGKNDTFKDWPRREWAQMYELSLDIGFSPSFGVLLQARTESPFLMKEHLEYQYTYDDEQLRTAERVASAWNALTAWRGSQSIGLRYRWGQGSQVNLLFVEDWGTGDRDSRGDFLYVNNAPDVAFINQWHFVF